MSARKKPYEKLDQAMRFTVWINRSLHAKAVAAARADGRSLSNWIRHMITQATSNSDKDIT